MRKVYHLSTCDTCKRIIKELEIPTDFEFQDIKKDSISNEDLEQMFEMTGSYESLFNKRAKLYKERDLKNKNLEEPDYKELILEHYTFLKRPVIVFEDEIFIGNAKKTVAAAKTSIHG